MLTTQIRSMRGEKSVKQVICRTEDQKQLQNMKQWEENGSPGSGTETAACRQHWLGGGALGCCSKVIRKSRLSHKRVPFAGESLGYHCPEGFTENLKASRTAWLDWDTFPEFSWVYGPRKTTLGQPGRNDFHRTCSLPQQKAALELGHCCSRLAGFSFSSGSSPSRQTRGAKTNCIPLRKPEIKKLLLCADGGIWGTLFM